MNPEYNEARRELNDYIRKYGESRYQDGIADAQRDMERVKLELEINRQLINLPGLANKGVDK